ncbi:MAG: ABC transporter substrate-binding protein [Spirochaetes bacterium]|nr:ABC transporter substrate-binding protein [Spirochaetota bacterium]
MKKLFLFSIICLLSVQMTYGAEEKIKLAIGFIPHIQFAPLYVGMEKGFFKAEGINLEIEYGFGVDIFSLLNSEKIDLGLSDSDLLIISSSKGFKAGAVFQYYQKYPVTVVALKGRIKNPADFTGKTIGTPDITGSSSIGMNLFLAEYGLQNKVKKQKIGYTQIQSLLSGRVDGVVCFSNNEPVQMRLAGKEIVQWDVGAFSDMVGASFITGEKQYLKKKKILAKFINASAKAVEWTVNNQNEAFEISKKYMNSYDDSQKEFNLKCLEATSVLFKSGKGYGYLDKAKYQKSIEIMKELKLIEKSYSADKIIYKF